MKNALKLLTALAAVAGAVYVIATYGDKIVAWAKKLVASCPCKNVVVTASDEESPVAEAPVEEVPTAEAVEEVPVEESPVEEAPVVPEGEPVAEDADFEA